MPTYDYECESCRHQFEQFQSITARPTRKCPECGRMKLHRLIGAGAGIIFKGSGFYQTDYRSESYKAAEKSETKSSSEKDKTKKKDEAKGKDPKSTDTTKSAKEDKKKSA